MTGQPRRKNRTLAFDPADNGSKVSYHQIADSRFGDNFLVAVHPNSALETSYEFRENEYSERVLSYMDLVDTSSGGGQWEEQWAELAANYRTGTAHILPSVDIDTDSNNNKFIERTEAEEADEDQGKPKRIFFNRDDDNTNGVRDDEDPGILSAPDNDLAPFHVSVGFPDYTGMEGYKLVLSHGEGLRLWGSQVKEPLTGYDPQTRRAEWDLLTANFIPNTFYVEGLQAGEGLEPAQRTVTWTLKDANGVDVASDAVTFRVEHIVWPDAGWMGSRTVPTSEWQGFALSAAWYIDKALEDLINGENAYIRTHYPQVKTDTVLGTDPPEYYTAPMGQTSHATEPAKSTAGYPNGFTMNVTFQFDGPEYMETWQRYAYTSGNNRETASFFRNSGVYIYDHYEVQIYDTDALLKALQAEDFNTYSVFVDGADRGVRGGVIDGNVRLYHELNPNQTPKYWTGVEPVNGCVAGVPYKKTTDSTLADLQTAAGWINGTGANTMVIVASPVDPNNLAGDINLTVTLNGVQTWTGRVGQTGGGADPQVVDAYVYLQSHWGSGVKFTSATIVSA